MVRGNVGTDGVLVNRRSVDETRSGAATVPWAGAHAPTSSATSTGCQNGGIVANPFARARIYAPGPVTGSRFDRVPVESSTSARSFDVKAILLTAYGDVDKLELRDVPDPTPGPGDIEVRMAGASINPIDWKLRSGALKAFAPLNFPAILGKDASGEVVEVGTGVSGFKVGARVLGRVSGAYAELVVGPADGWAQVPATMDLVDAGALPLVLLTGAQLIEEAVNPRAGDLLLLIGATGSVGRVAVFVAKARGAKVYAGVRSTHRAEAAKLGADGVVALDDDADIAKLPLLDAIADTVGGDTLKRLLGKVKPGGTVGGVVGEPQGAKERGLAARGMLAHSDARRLGELARAVAARELIIPIAKRFPLAEARAAQAFAEKGPGGKVILTG
jgi:NADPH:quinone reductase-like Zn-dependent oxidoreductase